LPSLPRQVDDKTNLAPVASTICLTSLIFFWLNTNEAMETLLCIGAVDNAVDIEEDYFHKITLFLYKFT
jgi:hypothetical protein